ncbi:MAG: type II toxin-antitoxin system VapC family toxin [Acidimicrobiales bacterium]
MAVVVDANLVVKLLAGEPVQRAAAHRCFAAWAEDDERVLAPHLLAAEVLNALWRTYRLGVIDAETLEAKGRGFVNMQLTYRALPPPGQVFDVAGRLGQSRAYDACYVALAIREHAVLHTMDGPLSTVAKREGLPVVLVT